MDFDLPDIDGITLARQLAQQYPSLVLIGFSAHVIDETLRQRTSSLFRGIIPKPVRVKCWVSYWHLCQLQVNNDQSLDVSQLNEDAQLMGTEKITNGWYYLHNMPCRFSMKSTLPAPVRIANKACRASAKKQLLEFGNAYRQPAMRTTGAAAIICPLPHEEITRSVADLEAWLNKKDLNAI